MTPHGGYSQQKRSKGSSVLNWNMASRLYCALLSTVLSLKQVVGYRWLHNGPGGGGPKLPDGQPLLQKDFATRSRKDILKRYKSHTKHCKACSNALWWVRFGKVAAQVLACMIAAWGLLTVQQAQTGTVKSIGSCWGIFAAAIAKGLVAYNLFKLENAFIFKNYEQWKS